MIFLFLSALNNTTAGGTSSVNGKISSKNNSTTNNSFQGNNNAQASSSPQPNSIYSNGSSRNLHKNNHDSFSYKEKILQNNQSENINKIQNLSLQDNKTNSSANPTVCYPAIGPMGDIGKMARGELQEKKPEEPVNYGSQNGLFPLPLTGSDICLNSWVNYFYRGKAAKKSYSEHEEDN